MSKELKLPDDNNDDRLLTEYYDEQVHITCDVLRNYEYNSICLSKDSAKKLVEFLNEFIDEV